MKVDAMQKSIPAILGKTICSGVLGAFLVGCMDQAVTNRNASSSFSDERGITNRNARGVVNDQAVTNRNARGVVDDEAVTNRNAVGP